MEAVMDWKIAVSLFFAPFLSIEPVMDWKTAVSLFFCTVPVKKACDGLKNCCKSFFFFCTVPINIEPVMDWKHAVKIFCTVPVKRGCDGLKNCCESIFCTIPVNRTCDGLKNCCGSIFCTTPVNASCDASSPRVPFNSFCLLLLLTIAPLGCHVQCCVTQLIGSVDLKFVDWTIVEDQRLHTLKYNQPIKSVTTSTGKRKK